MPNLLHLLALAAPLVVHGAVLQRRGVTSTPEDLNGKSFDYVIVGGGAAGLAVAARLSEDSSVTVAVIEAGGDASDVADRVAIPALTYLDGVAVRNNPHNWGYTQNNLGRDVDVPRGKILGGSSAINALYIVRASKSEHDAWATLNPNATQDWSWDGFYPWMRHVEDFSAPNSQNASYSHIEWNPDFHSTGGPIAASYPLYQYEQLQHWVPTLANLGIATHDPQGGEGWGAFITPNSIVPGTQTRADSKTGYLDPASSRSNLIVLLSHQATKIGFNTNTGGNPAATNVEFQPSAEPAGTTDENGNVVPGQRTVYSVNANKEVIVCAGVFGTPQLLQLSGVGPRGVLEANGITVVRELPGVGEHLQDHVLVPISFNVNASTTGDLLGIPEIAAQHMSLYKSGQFGSSMYTAPNNAIAYINLKQLFASSAAVAGTPLADGGAQAAADFVNAVRNNITQWLDSYPNLDPTVRAGYELTFRTELEDILNSDVGVIEILLSNTGNFNGDHNKTMSFQASIQHPFHRGSVMINSANPFALPTITPNYLNNDADWTVLREGLKFARRIANTAPMSSIVTEEIWPGPLAVTDADLDNHIWYNAATQYHPASTASQLPLDKGGVVDTELKVYGVDKLRVIDSSIIPIGLCAHLMWPTFAIAEKGAAIIQGKPAPAIISSAVSNPGSGDKTSGGNNGTTGSNGKSAALPRQASAMAFLTIATTLCATLLGYL